MQTSEIIETSICLNRFQIPKPIIAHIIERVNYRTSYCFTYRHGNNIPTMTLTTKGDNFINDAEQYATQYIGNTYALKLKLQVHGVYPWSKQKMN